MGLTSVTQKAEWRKIIVVVVATLAVPIIPFIVVGELPGQQWLAAAGSTGWRVGGTGATLLSLDLLLPIPSSLVGTLLGARLGLPAGFVWTCAGLVVGHMVGFALGRLWPARFAPSVANAPSGLAVFLSRPVPVFAEAVAIAAGAARLPWHTYVLCCVGGDAVYAFVLAANGARFLPQHMVLWALLLPMGLPLVSWLVWRAWRRRTTQTAASSGRN